MNETGADVIGLDWRIPLDEGWSDLDHRCAVQGNLDPVAAVRRLEGIEVACRGHSPPRRRTPRPHLQSRPRHPARDSGRKCKESRSLRAGLFGAWNICPISETVALKRKRAVPWKSGASAPRKCSSLCWALAPSSARAKRVNHIHDSNRHHRRRHLRTRRRFRPRRKTPRRRRLDYTLYESSSRLGGVLRTEHIDGCIVEAGPDSFITEKPWAADLCRTLGLGDQLIGSNDADRKTYILVRGRLIPMPDGLMFMVPTKILPTGFSPLFSWNTKLRMAQELFHPPRPAEHDESVAALVERHYGCRNGRPPCRSAPLRRLRRRSRQPQRSRRASPLR